MSRYFYVHLNEGSDLGAEVDDWIADAEESLAFGIEAIEHDDGGWLFYTPEGSIRGCSVTVEPERLAVCMSLMSSAADWRLCCSFLRMLIEKLDARVVDEEGAPATFEMLTEEFANESAAADLASGISVFRDLLDDGGDVAMPFYGFQTSITREQFAAIDERPDAGELLRKHFVDQVRKYSSAHLTGVIELNSGGTAAAWASVSTIICDVDFVVLSIGTGERAQYHALRIADVREVLGARMERVSRDPVRWYLPELSIDDEEDLQIMGKLISNAFDVATLSSEK